MKGPVMPSQSSTEPADFFKAIVEVPSPSGYEQPAARLFREYVGGYADAVETNVMGSVHALVKGTADGPSVMLAAHIDEIGLMASYITAEGFVAFRAIGGVDAAVLPGTRVRVHTAKGPLLGIVGRMPIHLLDEDDRKAVPKLYKLFIDLGLDCEAVSDRVRLGDPITFDVGMEPFGEGMAVSRAFDDKMGVYVIAEVGRRVAEKGHGSGDLTIAATVQEEIGMRGGITSAFTVQPDVGVAVDVGHATDYPDIDKRRHGDVSLGKGPILTRGANINPYVFELLVAAAESAGVPVQFEGDPRATGTDANAIQLSRGGRAAGLVSVPLRYMHTQNEMLALKDVESAIELLTAFVLELQPGTDLTP
jgi:putative aminopeptidase FrvX